MKEILEYLAKALVDDPDQVRINEVEGDVAVIYELRVAPDDVGKVIGKKGKTINAIRTVVKAAAVKNGKKVNVEVIT